MSARDKLVLVHRDLAACRACPKMIGPVVHGPAVVSRVFLLGQAPGPHEGALGRPFAWTAGKTLFRWLEGALGANEDEVRRAIYFAAVARCFPGKAPGGGDRRPDPDEIDRCRVHLEREVAILRPKLVLAVGTLAIEQVLGEKVPLADVVGEARKIRWLGLDTEVFCLPHPSGASTWFKRDPGKSLLERALANLREHPEIARAFTSSASPPRDPSRRPRERTRPARAE